MASDELLDWCDAQGSPGGVASRREVHARGLWHRTLHLWIATVNEGGSLVYQLRSATTASWPGLLDASVAGHLLAGESYSDAMRESREEIGVAIPTHEVIALGERREENRDPAGGWNREIQGVRLVRLDDVWDRFNPLDGEAAGLVRIGHDAAVRLFGGEAPSIRCEALLGGSGAIGSAHCDVTCARFVPRPARYYLAVHEAARRMIAGEPASGLAAAFASHGEAAVSAGRAR